MVHDKFVTDIQTKANIFNNFFADQCTPLKNDIVLPTSQMLLTSSRLCALKFNEEEIIKIIRNLNVHKTHGHDDIILVLLLLLLLSNIILVHKNNDKRLVNNYRPTSLIHIFANVFEKIIFNRICNFLLEEDLLNPNQSGFRSSDSCVNQLISMTHEIFEAFDCNPPLQVRSVFLDTPKAFDKVWHEGLFISSNLWASQENFTNFLKITYQVDSKGLF